MYQEMDTILLQQDVWYKKEIVCGLLAFITVGYIIGILWGLYLKVNIVPIIFLCLFGLILLKNKLKIINKYTLSIAILLIMVLVSNLQVTNLENKFNTLYKDIEEVQVVRNNNK